jgi:hypothetical protein
MPSLEQLYVPKGFSGAGFLISWKIREVDHDREN